MPWVADGWPKPYRKLAMRKFRARERQALRRGSDALPMRPRCHGWYW
jgi:hypothetical protein